MKVIHDLKNPIIAIQGIIQDLHDEKLERNINCELDGMREMLEVLKTEFKANNNMSFKEKYELVNSKDLADSLLYTHQKLAFNGKNSMTVNIQSNFPERILISPTITKRIINNLISNSLKHTTNRTINIEFTNCKSVSDIDIDHNSDSFEDKINFIHKGVIPDPYQR